MKSVYVKISLWSVAFLLCSFVLFIVIARNNVYRTFSQEGELGHRLVSQMGVARKVYETDGKQALARYLDSQTATYPGFQYDLVNGGKDVITGQDRSQLYARTRSRWQIFALPGPILVSAASADGRYALLATVPSRNWSLRPYVSYFLVLLCAIAVLSWVLALQFASPLNQLADAVRRFGAGDLGARARSARQDEIGELARAFDQMADRIQTLLTAERRLLQDVSHELRSPLARLSLAAELTRTSPDREAAAARVNREVHRLTDLVETLEEVTRAEGDPSERNIEELTLGELLREVAEDCNVEASARACSVIVSGASDSVLRGDRELLRRAIENIVRNAIRHAPVESGIEVTLNGAPNGVSVAIRDYGPGVPGEALRLIFKPFFRLDYSRDRASGGMGLGLAIAQRAIQLHNGEVWAENAEPGLRVTVKLPVGGGRH